MDYSLLLGVHYRSPGYASSPQVTDKVQHHLLFQAHCILTQETVVFVCFCCLPAAVHVCTACLLAGASADVAAHVTAVTSVMPTRHAANHYPRAPTVSNGACVFCLP